VPQTSMNRLLTRLRTAPRKSRLLWVAGVIGLLVALVGLCSGRSKPKPTGSTAGQHIYGTLVCLGRRCTTMNRSKVPSSRSWMDALSRDKPFKGNEFHCRVCDARAMSRVDQYPAELWSLARTIKGRGEPPPWLTSNQTRMVPSASKHTICPDMGNGWRHYPVKPAPCSSSRGGDVAVIRNFFTDDASGLPLHDGIFLEMGSGGTLGDGLSESNSWLPETCLGWRGIIVDSHPIHFGVIAYHRRASLNLRFAACPTGRTNGTIKLRSRPRKRKQSTASDPTSNGATPPTRSYSDAASAYRGGYSAGLEKGYADGYKKALEESTTQGRGPTYDVQCEPVGSVLGRLHVHRVDFVSLDMPVVSASSSASRKPKMAAASEVVVLRSLANTLSIGVLLVKWRENDRRPAVFEYLLSRGMHYVGQLTSHGEAFNGVGARLEELVADVYINVTHMRRFWPRSRGAMNQMGRSKNDEHHVG